VQGYKGGRPIETPLTYNDYVSAMLGIQLITAALYRRMETGEGFYADFAEAEVTLHVLPQGVFDWMINERNQVRQGNADDFHPVHNCFRCAGDDKWVAIVAGAGEEWPGLCRAIGRVDWLRDPRLATREGRMACRGELEAALREWARTRTATEASAMLQRHGVPAGPAYQIDELLKDPQMRARSVFRKDAIHPYTGHRIVPAPSLRVEGVPIEMGRSPLWKEHNAEVFGSLLGVPAKEVKRLEHAGVVA